MGNSNSKSPLRARQSANYAWQTNAGNGAHTEPPPSYNDINSSNPFDSGSHSYSASYPDKFPSYLDELDDSLAGPSNSSNARMPVRRGTAEDALQVLRRYDTILIVDDSLSMQGKLWQEATDALSQLAQRAGEYDTDGIDIYFLNDRRVGKGMKDESEVRKLFRTVRPSGHTPIADRLESLIFPYMQNLEKIHDTKGPEGVKELVKPVNYIIITDGAPSDDPESVIEQTAKRLDKRQCPITQLGIQFVQIGNDPTAARYLRELDDEMDAVRDIVDTTPSNGHKLDERTLVKILLGGIHKRVDRKGAVAVM